MRRFNQGMGMQTKTATARSTKTDTGTAAREAAETALARLGGEQPGYGFLFASPPHDLAKALQVAAKALPHTHIAGATTAGEFTEEGLSRDGIAVMLVASSDTRAIVQMAHGVSSNPAAAAQTVCRGFSQVSRDCYSNGWKRSTSVVLVDGLCGVGDRFVDAVREETQAFQQIVGGAAGDGGAFKATYVGADGKASTDAAAVVHLFGSKQWGVGVGHGLRPYSSVMRVTRSEGNVVREIDGRPAFDAYVQHARHHGVQLTKDNAGAYMIAHEIGILFVDEIRHARAPLSVGDDGSLSCAADVPAGARICILDGDPTAMVNASRRAAEEAKENLRGAEAAGVIVFDCVCRGIILGERFEEEVAGVRKVFGDVPVVGFLTYGEIARYTGKLHGWHNTTAVVAAIPA